MIERKKFNPHPYQHHIIGHQLDLPRGATWAGMGLGKTVSTLIALDMLELVEPGPALVLAPKRVAASTWPDEAKKWDNLRDIEVSAMIGTPQERRAALRKTASVYTINYDNLPWLVETLGDKWPFTKIVSDESTRLKSFRLRQGGKRAQALARVAHNKKVTRFIELTGTPSPNGLKDLWGQLWFLDRGERLGRTFESFKARWFQSVPAGGDGRLQIVPLPFAQEQIQDRVRDLCLTLDAKDWFDIDEPIVVTKKFELPAKARQLYRDMEREMFMQLEETGVEAFNAASRTMKCLQLASGSVWVDSEKGKWAEVHDEKLQILESIVEEAAGMPVLVRYHWVPSLQRILGTFKQARQLDDNPQTIRDWDAGKIPILVAHAQSCGHGLNLQDGSNIYVEFDGWWDLEHYQQITERIGPVRQKQSGYDRPVFHYRIVAENTVDEIVMARLEGKREVQDLLLEAMKRRKTHA